MKAVKFICFGIAIFCAILSVIFLGLKMESYIAGIPLPFGLMFLTIGKFIAEAEARLKELQGE